MNRPILIAAFIFTLAVLAALLTLTTHFRTRPPDQSHGSQDSHVPVLRGSGAPRPLDASKDHSEILLPRPASSEEDLLRFLGKAPSSEVARWLDAQPPAVGTVHRALTRALDDPAVRADRGSLLLQWWLRATPIEDRYEKVVAWLIPSETEEFLERLIPALNGSAGANMQWASIAGDARFPEAARISAIECARPQDLLRLIGSVDLVLEGAVLTQLSSDPGLHLTPEEHGWIVERACRVGRTEQDIAWDLVVLNFAGRVYRSRGLPRDLLSYASDRLAADKGTSEALIAAVARCIEQGGRSSDWTGLESLLDETQPTPLLTALLDYLPADATVLSARVDALAESRIGKVQEAATRALSRLRKGR